MSALAALTLLTLARAAPGGDWAATALFDGERTGLLGNAQFLNNWGGGFFASSGASIVRDTTMAHAGDASVRANLGTLAFGASRTFQTYAGPVVGQASRQTRDMTQYASASSYVRNDSGAPLTLKYEIKDYRNSSLHRATYATSLAADGQWTRIDVPLDLGAPGWVVDGEPDLGRVYVNSFIVTPQSGTASGAIHFDDFTLHEAAGSVDPATAPISVLAERLAERQFMGLWTARNRATGLIYNTTDAAGVAALNATAGVIQTLPSAIRRGWVGQADADAMVAAVSGALQANLDQTTSGQQRYVPTRFLNAATGARPGGDNEESSIDASFLLLALQGYKSRPATSPATATAVGAAVDRFRLDAFAAANGFRLAYFPASGFTGGAYDGYTNEGKVISLAAESSATHHVPLAAHWNDDLVRTRAWLVNPDDAHLVHSSSMYRAPFEQALLNLFVDTSQRGVDNYPVRSLATNPWQNYVRYERETAARLAELGRDELFQPDAGNGGVGGYNQYSLYNDFSQSNLFMPWSAALALLAGAPGADDALRTLMDAPLLNGPLGLADSARWNTGAAGPANVPAWQDNWNMALSTMALLEYLDGAESASRYFAELPQIEAALNAVFVEGDLDGDGATNSADLLIWTAGFGVAAGATPALGDADGDGRVDGADFLRWQRGAGATAAARPAAFVPEPSAWLLVAAAASGLAAIRLQFSRAQALAAGGVRARKKATESACSRRNARLESTPSKATAPL